MQKRYHHYSPNYFADNHAIMSAYMERQQSSDATLREKNQGRFRFRRNTATELDDIHSNIKSVTFAISRGSNEIQIIKFGKAVTVHEAVLAVEEFLSYNVTNDYLNAIKRDTWSLSGKLPTLSLSSLSSLSSYS